MEVTFLYYFLGSVAFVIAALLWITNQFGKLRDHISKQVDKVLDKLEYHERHDDDRFGRIANQLMEVRIANARFMNGKKSLGRDTENP